MAAEISFCVLIPLLLGIAIIVIGSGGAGRLDPSNASYADLLWLSLFIVSLTLAGILIIKTFGLSKADNTAIEMEVVIRNINLGLLIKLSLFPVVPGQTNIAADLALMSLLIDGGWQILMSFWLTMWRRR
jgi:BASS family bile acid:Na+ symporter